MYQIVYVTGGGELTITSTAAASTISNVHLEVIGHTSLVLDVPDLTMSGIYQSVNKIVVIASLSVFHVFCRYPKTVYAMWFRQDVETPLYEISWILLLLWISKPCHSSRTLRNIPHTQKCIFSCGTLIFSEKTGIQMS